MSYSKSIGIVNLIGLCFLIYTTYSNGSFSFLNTRTFFGGKRNEKMTNEIENDRYLMIFPLLLVSSASIFAAGLWTDSGFAHGESKRRLGELMKETKVTMSLDDYLSGKGPGSKAQDS